VGRGSVACEESHEATSERQEARDERERQETRGKSLYVVDPEIRSEE
jgi:hypothetical protein